MMASRIPLSERLVTAPGHGASVNRSGSGNSGRNRRKERSRSLGVSTIWSSRMSGPSSPWRRMSRISDWPTRRKKTLMTSAVRTAATNRSWNSSVAGSIGAPCRVAIEVDRSRRARRAKSTLPTSTTDQGGAAADRLVDDAEHRRVEATVAGDHLPPIGIERFVVVGRRLAAGFEDHQAARADVPGLEWSFPETVEAPGGDVAEVQGRGSVAAGSLRGVEEDVPDGRGFAALLDVVGEA